MTNAQRPAEGEGSQAMIGKAAFRNFKSLRDVQIDLERFTVFVGPNASGKSSILQGLDLMCRVARSKDVERKVTGEKSHGSQTPVKLTLEVAGQWYRYLAPSPENADKSSPKTLISKRKIDRNVESEDIGWCPKAAE